MQFGLTQGASSERTIEAEVPVFTVRAPDTESFLSPSPPLTSLHKSKVSRAWQSPWSPPGCTISYMAQGAGAHLLSRTGQGPRCSYKLREGTVNSLRAGTAHPPPSGLFSASCCQDLVFPRDKPRTMFLGTDSSLESPLLGLCHSSHTEPGYKSNLKECLPPLSYSLDHSQTQTGVTC